MMQRVFASLSRHRALALGLFALVGLAWSSLVAAANCTSSSATMTLPDVTITSNNIQAGTVLATSAPVTIAFTCTGLPVTTTRPADYTATIQAGQTLATLDSTNNVNGPGITFKVNGVNGVALVVTASPVQATSHSGQVEDGPNKYAGYPVGSVTAPPGTSQGSYGSTFTETFIGQLVVTGRVTTGTITATPLIPFWWYVPGGSQYSSSIPLGTNLSLGASQIKSGSCSVNLDSQNLSVTLPDITASALSGATPTAGKTPFNINLTCKSSSKDVYITMTASNPGSATGVALSPGSGYAGNVGVQILNGAGAAVDVTGTKPQRIATSTSNGSLSIPYYAQYYRTAMPVTAGQVNATVTFVMTYQ